MKVKADSLIKFIQSEIKGRDLVLHLFRCKLLLDLIVTLFQILTDNCWPSLREWLSMEHTNIHTFDLMALN